MPSTYSTSLKLQLIGTGEQAGTWGTTTNTNLGTLLEQAITGVVTIPMGDATYTLTNYNGLSDEARNAVLMLNGPITAPQYLVAPPGQQKVYIVRNRTGNTVTLTTGTGSNISIANAGSEVVYCDGANFYSATQFNYINGDLTVSNSVYVGQSITLGNDMYGNSATGQWYVPVGNSTVRTNSPINGVIRYNTDLQAYEGYANSNWVTFNVSREGVYSIGYWFVAGGGGGGVGGSSPVLLAGGGGGGGGYLSSASAGLSNITPGVTYTVVVGAGGASGGANGSNTNALGFVAIGGGGGGTQTSQTGKSGGSGGGSGGGSNTGGSGFSGQGNAGGSSGGLASGSAGGGATGAGGGAAGTGGAGTSTSITGISVAYCGGGGGAGYDGNSGGAGGSGGGGAGGTATGGTSGVSGTIYTGGGGGGGSTTQGTDGGGAGSGGNGGSGVAILSIPTSRYTGTTTGSPLVSTFGNATILTFLASGTYTA